MEEAVSQFESNFTRSSIAFSAFFLLLALGLYVLYESASFGEGRRLLAGLFLATGIAVWLGRPGALAMMNLVVAPIQRYELRTISAFVALGLGGYLFVAWYVLDTFPNSGDELAYVMQAQTYSQGRLWATPPSLVEAFEQYRFIVMDGKWVSEYAPGWAMLLAPFAVLDLPLWIVNPIIGAATLAAFFVLSRKYVSREAAWIGVLLLGASSFFILNSGSYFPHSVTTLYGIAFVLAGLRYIAARETWCAVVAGLCIGLMGLTRTQNALIFALPFVITLAITPTTRKGLFWFVLGGTPFLAVLLALNFAVTGNPLISVQSWHESELFGVPNMATFELTLDRFLRLSIWTSPALVLGYALAFLALLRRRDVGFSDWVMPVTVLSFLFFYADGGNQYGPRYYFEAWPFAILTVLKTIDPILFGVERDNRSAWVSSALITGILIQISYLPAHLEREHRVVIERQDVYRQAARAGLDNALVIIADSVGVIRPMGPEDLVRNGLHIGEQKIIYAHKLSEKNIELRSQFPDRAIFVYSDGQLTAAPMP